MQKKLVEKGIGCGQGVILFSLRDTDDNVMILMPNKQNSAKVNVYFGKTVENDFGYDIKENTYEDIWLQTILNDDQVWSNYSFLAYF